MTGGGRGPGTMGAVASERTAPGVDPGAPDPTALDPAADAASRRRARIWVWILLGMVAIAIAVVSMIGRERETSVKPAPKAFCKAAKAYEKELDTQAEDNEVDIAAQVELVQAIADTAPKDVKADADLFLSQMEKLRDAPNAAARAKLQDDPDVKQAVDAVNRRWSQGCDVFKRDSPL